VALTAAGATVATAESLTGGLLCAALTDVPGASVVVRGGVVAYATDLKAGLLGVAADLLAGRGPVDPDVARAMAVGAAAACGATYGVATTGVAGPDPQGDAAVGTVHVAVAGPGVDRVVTLDLAGDRAAVRAQTVAAALSLLVTVVAPPPPA
jgi:nicotinamide-nucleotide amidase